MTVGATGWNDMTIYYNFNSTHNTGKEVAANLKLCCSQASLFTTTGQFDMSTSVHDYSDVEIGTLITLVSCEGHGCPSAFDDDYLGVTSDMETAAEI